MNLTFCKTHEDAITPTYATDGSAAVDLYACGPHAAWFVSDGRPAVISTGIACAVPEGHVLLLFSRSGHGARNAVRLSNCTGVIDPDYRGEITVCLTGDPGVGLHVKHGDRIAQALLVPTPRLDLIELDHLPPTTRGAGGFGSTGQ